MSTPLLSTFEVAEYLGVSTNSIISLANSGKLRGQFFLRQWKFTQSDVDTFIESQRRGR